MPDFRVDETAPEHPKLRAAGLAAAGLWALAGGYAMRELTDGFVPDYWIQTWPGGRKHAATLVKVGLWRREQRHGIDGFRFHDWDGYQRSAAQVSDEKQRARDRAAKSYQRRRSPTDSAPQNDRSLRRRDAEVCGDSAEILHDSLSLSLSLSPGGYVGGESHPGIADDHDPPSTTSENGTNPQHTQRPPDRCQRHLTSENPPNCGQCADARRAAEAHDQAVERDRIRAVRACRWCDADGVRIDPANRHRGSLGVTCDHTARSAEQLAELAS